MLFLRAKYFFRVDKDIRDKDKKDYNALVAVRNSLETQKEQARSALVVRQKDDEPKVRACISETMIYPEPDPCDMYDAIPYPRYWYCHHFYPPYDEHMCNKTECPMHAQNNKYVTLNRQYRAQQKLVEDFWAERIRERVK